MSVEHRPSRKGDKVITAYDRQGVYLGVRMALRQENGLRGQMKEETFNRLIETHRDQWANMDPKCKFKIEEVQ